MKILQLREDHEVDLGEYGPACEGFVDTIKKLFAHKSRQQERAALIHGKDWHEIDLVAKDLDHDLRNTYENPGWVKNNLEESAENIHVPGLKYANVNGQALKRPQDIVRAAEAMLSVVEDIAHSERPHTDLRRRLCKQAEAIKNNAELDSFWDKHENELKESAVDRARKKYKRPFPALGFDSKKNTWPVNFSEPKDSSFSLFARTETSGEFEAPTQSTATQYADAIRVLLGVAQKAEKLARDNYIPYWDSLDDAIEYDNLKNGDEIFRQLFSSQNDDNVFDLAQMITTDLGPIICGMYIAMFDKKLVARQPANEGFMDIFRGKSAKNTNSEEVYKFDSHKAFAKCKAFYANPGQWQMTGRSFDPSAGLILSIGGHAPNPNEIASALKRTWKEASDVGERMGKNAVQFARIVRPLIDRFEKTVIAAMDRNGDLPQDVLDEAMKPLVANAKRAREANAWYSFFPESGKYDGWIGGNPVHMKELNFRGTPYYDIDYSVPKGVAVSKASDAKQLQEILDVLFEYTSEEHWGITLKGGMDEGLLDDVDTFFEFDRPVRHLWDMMSDEQTMAINAIYAHESTSGSLQSSIAHREWQVCISILKYVELSIASL